jgi:hypothetical protein
VSAARAQLQRSAGNDADRKDRQPFKGLGGKHVQLPVELLRSAAWCSCTLSETRLLIALMTRARWKGPKKGQSWASREQLAVDCGLSERAMEEASKRLRGRGLISWVPGERVGKRQGTNRYTVNLDVSPHADVNSDDLRPHVDVGLRPHADVDCAPHADVEQLDEVNETNTNGDELPTTAADRSDEVSGRINAEWARFKTEYAERVGSTAGYRAGKAPRFWLDLSDDERAACFAVLPHAEQLAEAMKWKGDGIQAYSLKTFFRSGMYDPVDWDWSATLNAVRR